MNEKNVVYEWATKIKDAANNGYYSDSEEYKDVCFGVILGLCAGILCTMNCVEEPKHCKDCKHIRVMNENIGDGRFVKVSKCVLHGGRLEGNEACEKFEEK